MAQTPDESRLEEEALTMDAETRQAKAAFRPPQSKPDRRQRRGIPASSVQNEWLLSRELILRLIAWMQGD